MKNIAHFSFKPGMISVIGSLMLLMGVFLATPVTAAAAAQHPASIPVNLFAADCSDIKNAEDKEKATSQDVDGANCIYQKYINPLIRFVSAIAGVAVVISIVIAGIQYSMAGGDPGKVAAAKQRITQSIIALLAFIFLLSFLQWLTPGGLSGIGG